MSSPYNDLQGTWKEYEASPCASLRDRFIGAARIYFQRENHPQPDITELTTALVKTVAENKFLDGRCEALTLSVYDWRVQWQHAMDKVRYLERQVEVLENDAALGDRAMSTAEPVSVTEPPERINVAQDSDGFWTCREAVIGSQEYVRSDIERDWRYEALRLKSELAALSHVQAPAEVAGWTFWHAYGEMVFEIPGHVVVSIEPDGVSYTTRTDGDWVAGSFDAMKQPTRAAQEIEAAIASTPPAPQVDEAMVERATTALIIEAEAHSSYRDCARAALEAAIGGKP